MTGLHDDLCWPFQATNSLQPFFYHSNWCDGALCCAAGISQTLSAAKGELYRVSNQDAQQNITWVNYTALEPDACPPILCKMRALTTAACQAYKVSAVLLLIQSSHYLELTVIMTPVGCCIL